MNSQVKGAGFTRGRYTVEHRLKGQNLRVTVFDGSSLQKRFKVVFPWDTLNIDSSTNRHRRNGGYQVSAFRSEKKRKLLFWVTGPDDVMHYLETSY
jgi:hypothetical protein